MYYSGGGAYCNLRDIDYRGNKVNEYIECACNIDCILMDHDAWERKKELTKNIRNVIEGIYWLTKSEEKNVNGCIKYLLVIVKGFFTVFLLI